MDNGRNWHVTVQTAVNTSIPRITAFPASRIQVTHVTRRFPYFFSE
jgi:hypothetical protein